MQWRGRFNGVRFAWALARATGPGPVLGLLATRAGRSVIRALNKPLILIDPRLNTSINWRHPLAVPFAIALGPIGLVAKFVLGGYIWATRRHG